MTREDKKTLISGVSAFNDGSMEVCAIIGAAGLVIGHAIKGNKGLAALSATLAIGVIGHVIQRKLTGAWTAEVEASAESIAELIDKKKRC